LAAGAPRCCGGVERNDLACELSSTDWRRSGKLAPATPVDRLLPRTLPAADGSRTINPAVTAAQLGVDVAHLHVKINEGVLYPTVT